MAPSDLNAQGGWDRGRMRRPRCRGPFPPRQPSWITSSGPLPLREGTARCLGLSFSGCRPPAAPPTVKVPVRAGKPGVLQGALTYLDSTVLLVPKRSSCLPPERQASRSPDRRSLPDAARRRPHGEGRDLRPLRPACRQPHRLPLRLRRRLALRDRRHGPQKLRRAAAAAPLDWSARPGAAAVRVVVKVQLWCQAARRPIRRGPCKAAGQRPSVRRALADRRSGGS